MSEQNLEVEQNDTNIDEAFAFLDEKFLNEYENIEVASNLPDGIYTMSITKSEVLPTTKHESKTVMLAFSAKVQQPSEHAGKFFRYEFTMSDNNKPMMKKMFYALDFEFDLRSQMAAFSRLPGSTVEISISTNGQYKNQHIRRLVEKGDLLARFFQNLSTQSEL